MISRYPSGPSDKRDKEFLGLVTVAEEGCWRHVAFGRRRWIEQRPLSHVASRWGNARVTENLAVTIATASGGNIGNKGEAHDYIHKQGKRSLQKRRVCHSLAPRVGDFVEWSDVFGKAKVLSVTHRFSEEDVRAFVDVDFADVPHLSPGA